jgi:hypothetical protein
MPIPACQYQHADDVIMIMMFQVDCPEWSTRFSISEASENSGDSIWDFLSRVDGGFTYQTELADKQFYAARWADLIANISNTASIFDGYFYMNNNEPGTTGLLRMQRVCPNRREVIRRHFDRSIDMQRDYINRDTNAADNAWPALQGLYEDGSTNLCQDVSGCSDLVPGLCGCTSAANVTFERRLFHPTTGDETTTPITRTPLTVAMEYLLGDLLAGPTVALNDFLGPPSTGGGGRVVGGRIPAYRYSRIPKDPINSKIRSSDVNLIAAVLLVNVTSNAINTNFMPRDPLMCRRVNIDNYPDGRSCIASSGAQDPKIKAAEDAFPGGADALKASRAKPAYLVISMDTDANRPDRSAAISAFVDKIYTNKLEPQIGTAAYLDSETYPAGADHGTMVLNLFNDGVVDLGYRGLDRDRSDQSGGSLFYATDGTGSLPAVDSFCGFKNPLKTRQDTCGQYIAGLLQECSSPLRIDWSTLLKATDRVGSQGQQTCIHDHSCVLSLMPKTKLNSKTMVRAPAWNLLLDDFVKNALPQDPKRWPNTILSLKFITFAGTCTLFDIIVGECLSPVTDATRQAIRQAVPWTNDIPWKDELPILELWRLHSNPVFPSKFHLPIGVFLETFRDQQTTDSQRTNPRDDPGGAVNTMGMWPMCPHLKDTATTSVDDARKSRMLQGVAISDNILPPIQHPTQVGAQSGQFCSASTSGVKECTVNGFRSYRVGLAPGYTMDKDSCGNTKHPMMVQGNIFQCVDCTWWQPTYCVGMHECLYVRPGTTVTAWDSVRYILNDDVKSITTGDTSFFGQFIETGNDMRRGMGDKQGILASLLAWSEEILKRMPVPGDTRYVGGDGRPNVFDENPNMLN